jgi:hypothetical protein
MNEKKKEEEMRKKKKRRGKEENKSPLSTDLGFATAPIVSDVS